MFLLFYNLAMIDTDLHTNYPFEGAYDCDHRNYNPGKPKIKHILWKHYDTVVSWDSTDNVNINFTNLDRLIFTNLDQLSKYSKTSLTL